MNKQLLKGMLAGAATLVASNAFAAGTVDSIAAGFKLTIDWDVPVTLTKADARFATVNKLSGEILIPHKGEKKIYAATKDSVYVKYDLTGSELSTSMATGIGCDEAGNVLFNVGWPGANQNTNWRIIPAANGVEGLTELSLTVPDGCSAARVDCIGRVLGDVLSEDGGLILMAPNGISCSYSFTIKNGQQDVEGTASSVAYPKGFSTGAMGIAQPYYPTFDEMVSSDDIASTACVYCYNVNTIAVPDFDSQEFTTIANNCKSNYGFDVFRLGTDLFYVIGAKNKSDYDDCFRIVRMSDNAVVAQFYNEAGAVNSGNYQSLIAHPNEDGTVSIYEYRCETAARKFTFSLEDEAPAAPALYILGNNGISWDPVNPGEFAYDTTTKTYSFDLYGATNGFKISTAKGTWSEFDAAGFHIDGTLAANTVTPLLSGAPAYGGNILLAEANDYTIVIDSALTTIKATVIPAPTPDKLFVIGNLSVGDWDPSKGIELTKNGDIFEGDVAMSGGYFSFIDELAATSGDWMNAGQRYGATSNNFGTHLNTAVRFMRGESAFNILDYTEYPQSVHFVVDFEKMTVTLTTATGVEDVAVDVAVPAEYYNLQGIRIAQPEAGKFYIVKKGDKVSKMLVK